MEIRGMTLSGVSIAVTPVPPVPSNLLINGDFTNGTTGWTAINGFDTYSLSFASKPAVYQDTLWFSYSEANAEVYQTVNIADIANYSQISATINIQHTQNGAGSYSAIDQYYVLLDFLNSSNTSLTTVRTPSSGTANAPQNATDVTLSLTRAAFANFNNIAKVKLTIYGKDAGFWNGNYGPRVYNASLSVS